MKIFTEATMALDISRSKNSSLQSDFHFDNCVLHLLVKLNLAYTVKKNST